MYEGEFRREAEVNNRGGDRPSRVHGRPDRVALWAVFLGLAATIAAAASAATRGRAGSGGTATPGVCEDIAFGDRPLQLGDCGDDVKTLNWVLGSKAYATGVGLDEEFGDLTDAAVRDAPASSRHERERRRRRRHARGAQGEHEAPDGQLVRPGVLAQRDLVREDAEAEHDRGRAQAAAVRHQGHVQQGRPLAAHEGGRPRPLHARRLLGPHPGGRRGSRDGVHRERARRADESSRIALA